MKPLTQEERAGLVPMSSCVPGRAYWLKCRNLVAGVYDGNEGFIGIRTKFGSRYLFTEYHWDQGPPYGTVKGCQDTGIDLPDSIPLTESLGTFDGDSDRELEWRGAVSGGGLGWCLAGTDTKVGGARAVRRENKNLFEFLDETLPKQTRKPRETEV